MNEDLNTVRAGTREALRSARADRANLLPVLGAGTSIPLGAPSWDDLVNRLAASAGIPPPVEEPNDALDKLQNHMGDRAFERAVQNELTLPEGATSLTLQTLVQAGRPLIVTTNLDHAIENAFGLAGQALLPQNVLCGVGEDLSLFGASSSGPQLLKLHGSLERPWTWVLTAKAYDRAYAQTSRLQEFFRHRMSIPFFIGFSLTDQDIGICLRMAQAWKQRGYAAILTQDVPQRRAKLNRAGIISIPFDSFDQLPEIVDEVFDAEPPRARIIVSRPTGTARLEVGAASVGLPVSQSETEALAAAHEAIRILNNALDGRPMRALTDGRARRDSGQKGNYLNALTGLLENISGADSITLDAVIAGLSTYGDVFFGSVVPHVLRRARNGHFEFFTRAASHLSEVSRLRLESDLLQTLTDGSLELRCRRDVCKVLALAKIHPAQELPPQTLEVDELRVCKYLLTRYQVGQLIGDADLIEERSVKPFALRRWSEADIVLQRLGETTGTSWRLPTRDEWGRFARVADGSWPWGSEGVRHLVHAHLRFRRSVRPSGTVEVGCFPQGGSPEGLLDLIGNVYELLDASREGRLAGGAWTTEVNEGATLSPKTFVMFGKVGIGSGNVGLRPVVGGWNA